MNTLINDANTVTLCVDSSTPTLTCVVSKSLHDDHKFSEPFLFQSSKDLLKYLNETCPKKVTICGDYVTNEWTQKSFVWYHSVAGLLVMDWWKKSLQNGQDKAPKHLLLLHPQMKVWATAEDLLESFAPTKNLTSPATELALKEYGWGGRNESPCYVKLYNNRLPENPQPCVSSMNPSCATQFLVEVFGAHGIYILDGVSGLEFALKQKTIYTQKLFRTVFGQNCYLQHIDPNPWNSIGSRVVSLNEGVIDYLTMSCLKFIDKEWNTIIDWYKRGSLQQNGSRVYFDPMTFDWSFAKEWHSISVKLPTTITNEFESINPNIWGSFVTVSELIRVAVKAKQLDV